MTPTNPPQILDRSALRARYRAARADRNDVKATAILAVLKYLDRGARATPDRSFGFPTVAEQFDALVQMCWWWAKPATTPSRSASLR